MFLKCPQSYWGCCCLVAKLMYNSSAAPWTVTRHAPLSLGFPRQEYQSGLPFPSPADLPDPRMEPTSPALAGGFSPLSHLGSLSGVEDIYIYKHRIMAIIQIIMQIKAIALYVQYTEEGGLVGPDIRFHKCLIDV